MGGDGGVLPVSLMLFLVGLTAVAMLLGWLVPRFVAYLRHRWRSRRQR